MSQSPVKSDNKSPNVPRRRRTKLLQNGTEKKIAEDEFMASAIGDVEWLRQSLRGSKGKINFDKNGLAPIHLASIHGRLECLRLLVEKLQVDINLPSLTGWRPLHLAISNQTGQRAFQCVVYLLNQGGDPTMCNEDGITPIHQAASEGHVKCLQALIETGAPLYFTDCRGHKPIDLAKLWGHRKCARILAAEQWHQNKDFLAHEMGQLKKLKIQQVLKELEEDKELEADQQFYGEQAFQEWLSTRGLKPKSTGPPSAEKSRQNSNSPNSAGKVSRGNTRQDSMVVTIQEPAQSSGLTKPNSVSREGGYPASRHVDTIPSSPGQHAERKVQVVSRKSTPQERHVTPKTRESGSTDDAGLHEKPQAQQTDEDPSHETEPLMYLPATWNKSTKVADTFSEYSPMLKDHYPRDEYTMLPKHAPKRLTRSPTINVVEQSAPSANKSSMSRRGTKDVQEDVGKPGERPVVYKGKHIDDVHKRKMPDVDQLPRAEIGMHLTNDLDSRLFLSGLIGVPSSSSSKSSVSVFTDMDLNNLSLQGIMSTMERKKTRFPYITEDSIVSMEQPAAAV